MLNRILEVHEYLNESAFKDKKAKWLKDNPKLKAKEIDVLFDEFKKLKKRGLIQSSHKDISRIETFDRFKKDVEYWRTKKSKREKVKNAIIHVDGADYRIVEPKSYEAMCKYGTKTKWCITDKGGTTWHKYYDKDQVRFIVIHDFEQDEKFALAIYPHDKGEDPTIDAFDDADDEAHTYGLIKKYNVPKKLLTNPVKKNTWSWFLSMLDAKGEVDTFPNGIIIDTSGHNFNFSNIGLKTLDFDGRKEIKCYADFHINENSLTSLEGSPIVMYGDFECRYNNLKDLKGAPKEINGGYFDCSHNSSLTSLKGGPKYVEGQFICSFCNLQDLRGLPEHTGAGVICDNNKLKSLMGMPKKIYGSVMAHNNPIRTLAEFPEEIKEDLWISFDKSVMDKVLGNKELIEKRIRERCKVGGKIKIV